MLEQYVKCEQLNPFLVKMGSKSGLPCIPCDARLVGRVKASQKIPYFQGESRAVKRQNRGGRRPDNCKRHTPARKNGQSYSDGGARGGSKTGPVIQACYLAKLARAVQRPARRNQSARSYLGARNVPLRCPAGSPIAAGTIYRQAPM